MTRLSHCALLALLLAGCAGNPPAPAVETAAGETRAPEQVSPAAAAPEAEQPAPPQPPRSPRRLSVTSVGDIMIGTDYPENHLPDDDGVSFLEAVAPLLRDADVTIGNLEGVLMDGGTPRKECSNPRACYLFRTPSRYARYFAEAGFDVMSLANNHSRDFGEEGRTASMENLAAAGIRHTGREGDFAFLEVDGLEIVVMGYAVTLNSNLLLDYDVAAETVRRLAGQADIVIITFHGGAEGDDADRLPFAEETYYGEMRGDVVRFARLMVDSGADLVVGHGPHRVRAMEHYRGRLIAYSLGNFATYYGISVEGDRGVAPILSVLLDEDGRFVEGRIHSTAQLRPAGPAPDPQQRALHLIRTLSIQDFTTPGIEFLPDGRLRPAARSVVRGE